MGQLNRNESKVSAGLQSNALRLKGIVAKPCLTKKMASLNDQGRVVQKPINASPGLKFNRGNKFSCIKVLSIACVLCSLGLLVLKTEGQKI